MRLVYFGYLVLVIIIFAQALLPSSGSLIHGDDIHRQYYFFREFFNINIRIGIFPWWNPYLFGGEPFIANPVVNIWYPINWLFVVLPLNIAYAWHLAFHVFWAMVGMFHLLISKQKINSFSAWVGGVIFGLSGFFMARTAAGHVDVIAAASWMPWVVWMGSKVLMIKNNKSILYFSCIFALQLLAGYQTMAFMTVIVVAVQTVFFSLATRSWKPIVRVGMGGLGAVGLAAFHLLPVSEFFRSSIRTYDFPYSWHAYGSLEWRSLIQFLNPFQFGNHLTYNGPPPNYIEHAAYVGIGGLILSTIGAAWIMREKKDSTFLFIVFFGLWVSLGSNAPIDLQYVLWKTIPMYEYLRIPPRHLILVVFGLAALSGIGFATLRVSRLFRLLIMVVVVGELVWFARSFIDLKPVPQTRHDKELIELLKQDDQPYRMLQNFGVWIPTRDALDFDSVMSYGIFSATGYDPSILRSYFDFVARSIGTSGEKAVLSHDVQVPYLTPQGAEAIDFLNIKYILVPQLYDPFADNPRYKLIWDDGRREYRLYENTTVFPRFFLDERSCGAVDVTSYTPNRIMISVESTCDTTLVSSEVYYPGWTATTDGKRVQIDKTKDTFRTLFVSKGKHTIVYDYFPKLFVPGVILSLFTVSIFIWVYTRRRTV